MHVLLDGCPSVRWVAEQPFRLDFDWDGQRARHFPDVEVEYAGRRLVLEIKKRDEAESDEVAARTRLLSPALARLGYSYRVITEEIYARQPRLRNVGWLLRRGREEVSVSQASALIQRIADKECAAWGELGELQFPAARLVLEGVLIVDLHNQISPDTQLMTAQGGDHVHWIH